MIIHRHGVQLVLCTTALHKFTILVVLVQRLCFISLTKF